VALISPSPRPRTSDITAWTGLGGAPGELPAPAKRGPDNLTEKPRRRPGPFFAPFPPSCRDETAFIGPRLQIKSNPMQNEFFQ